MHDLIHHVYIIVLSPKPGGQVNELQMHGPTLSHGAAAKGGGGGGGEGIGPGQCLSM